MPAVSLAGQLGVPAKTQGRDARCWYNPACVHSVVDTLMYACIHTFAKTVILRKCEKLNTKWSLAEEWKKRNRDGMRENVYCIFREHDKNRGWDLEVMFRLISPLPTYCMTHYSNYIQDSGPGTTFLSSKAWGSSIILINQSSFSDLGLGLGLNIGLGP